MLIQSFKSLSLQHSLEQFRHRCVRDLAWALLSPPLFQAIEGCPESWFLDDYIDAETLPWLNQLDTAPEVLYQHLSEQRSTRLGIYFEQLLSFYFEHYPRFELLAKNLQVNSKQRTLGEFDFIVQDQKENKTQHIEVAVKFYLGHEHYRGHIKNNEPLHNWHHWVGPNQKDSLAIKMRHLKEHQLTLAKTEAGIRSLEKINIKGEINCRLLIKGNFYLPQSKSIPMPAFHNPHLTQYFWIDSDSFLESQTKPDTKKHYCILPRNYWLSSLTKDDIEQEKLSLLSASELVDTITCDIAENINDWQVAEINLADKKKIESKRFFIINRQYLPSDK